MREFTNHTQKELTNLVVGKLLGQGVYRHVYASLIDPKVVIKIEQQSRCFSNIAEWEIWEHVKHTDQGKRWLAPCLHISPCGTVMLQRRTMPINKSEIPKRVPAWLTDLKLANWGRLGEQVVCHDYSNNLLMNQITTGKLKKANFFDYGS